MALVDISSGMADWYGGFSSRSPPWQCVDQWIQKTCSTAGCAQTNAPTSAAFRPEDTRYLHQIPHAAISVTIFSKQTSCGVYQCVCECRCFTRFIHHVSHVINTDNTVTLVKSVVYEQCTVSAECSHQVARESEWWLSNADLEHLYVTYDINNRCQCQ